MSGGKKPAQRRDVVELVCQVESLRAVVTELRDDVRGVKEIAAHAGAAIGNGRVIVERVTNMLEGVNDATNALLEANEKREHEEERRSENATDDLPAVRKRLEDALSCIRDVAMNVSRESVDSALTLIAEYASFAVYGACEETTREEFANTGLKAADRWRAGVGSEAEGAWRDRRDLRKPAPGAPVPPATESSGPKFVYDSGRACRLAGPCDRHIHTNVVSPADAAAQDLPF